MYFVFFIPKGYSQTEVVLSEKTKEWEIVFEVKQHCTAGLTGNILVGEWQIALLVHFRRVMECSYKSALKIC